MSYKADHKIKLRENDLIGSIHEYDLDLESNHIYLFGVDRGYEVTEDGNEPGVDFTMSNRFIRNIHLCMRVNPDKPIVIHLKSCGGDWSEGMAIYDAIRACPYPVTILNYTHARSMSSIIFQAGNKRVMMPHSIVMIHEGELGIYGTQKQVRSFVDFYDKTTEIMLNIYGNIISGTIGKSVNSVKKRLRYLMDSKEDVYFNAAESIKEGFADEIFDYNWKNLTTYTDKQLAR